MRTRHFRFLATILAAAAAAAEAEDFGKFLSKPVTEWDDDGRTMRLVNDFTFEDPSGELWTAPAGSPIDGASIPRILWWLVGGPYEGQYRNASIVHDVECREPYKHHWRAVHRMFYLGCRAGGVGLVKGKVMYAAVYHFGPRWPVEGEASLARTVESKDDALRLRVVIRKNPDISLDAIDGLSHLALVNQISDQELEYERQRLEEAQERRLNGEAGHFDLFD